MLNVADFVLIGIVALFIIVGATRGLVKTLFGLGSIILSIVLALTFYPMVSEALLESPVGGLVQENVEKLFGQTGEQSLPDSAESEKTQVVIPEVIMDTIDDAANQTKQAVSDSVSNAALNIISMLIVFVLVKLVLWIAAKVLDLATHLPVIHGCNKILGAAFGGVSGVLVIYLLLGLLTFTTLLNTTTDFGRTVQSSLLLSQMYENNILLYFLQSKS